MEFWLQKEGERQGRAISAATLEISSANYRLLGRCSSPFQTVEVRVDSPTPAGIDRKTSYHRSNAQGLIEILPYQDLSVGRWQIRCYADIMDELQGKGWQKSLSLIIFPPSFDYLAQLEALIQREIEPFLVPPVSTSVIQLQFADLEKNSSFIFDLCVPEKTEDWEKSIELPDPATMTKPLHRSTSPLSLPPKLAHTSSCGKSPQLPSIKTEYRSRPNR